MKRYNDKDNDSGMRVVFMFMQMFMLAVVYLFAYTSIVAVQYATKEYGASVYMYIPVLMVLVVYPMLLYIYRNMFNTKKMLKATVWTVSSASVMIILLYLHISQLVPQ